MFFELSETFNISDATTSMAQRIAYQVQGSTLGRTNLEYYIFLIGPGVGVMGRIN